MAAPGFLRAPWGDWRGLAHGGFFEDARPHSSVRMTESWYAYRIRTANARKWQAYIFTQKAYRRSNLSVSPGK